MNSASLEKKLIGSPLVISLLLLQWRNQKKDFCYVTEDWVSICGFQGINVGTCEVDKTPAGDSGAVSETRDSGCVHYLRCERPRDIERILGGMK